jgi:hypothetical protein
MIMSNKIDKRQQMKLTRFLRKALAKLRAPISVISFHPISRLINVYIEY